MLRIGVLTCAIRYIRYSVPARSPLSSLHSLHAKLIAYHYQRIQRNDTLHLSLLRCSASPMQYLQATRRTMVRVVEVVDNGPAMSVDDGEHSVVDQRSDM